MKKRIKLIASLTLIFAMLSAYIPVHAGYLEDVIIFDDLESYDIGYVPNGIKGWGSNADKPVDVWELDGNKVLRYKGTGGNSQFMLGVYTGKIWATSDIYIPDGFGDDDYIRVTYTNQNAYALVEINIYGNGTMRVRNIYKEDGTKETFIVCKDVPVHEGWFNLRGLLDTDKKTVKLYVNGEQKGEEYDFCYKKCTNISGIDSAKIDDYGVKRIQFANVTAADMNIYFDNIGFSYSREIYTDKEYIERSAIVDVYDDYELPQSMVLPLDGGISRELPIIGWSAENEEIDFENKQVGTYVYRGDIENTEKYVKYTVEIKDRYIEKIDDVYASTYQFADYRLPETVEALMSDGNKKEIPVIWDEDNVNTSSTGVVEVTGRVDSNHFMDKQTKLTIYVGITVYEVKEIENVYIGIQKGTQDFTLPDRIEAKVADGTKKDVAVTWDGEAPDTEKTGYYIYNGTVSGYFKPITLQVTVYEEDDEYANILDKLTEYYDHCLNEGRDRTRYGYGADEPAYVFASGINRLTGEHSEWQFEDGNRPITDLASQTVLMKGLISMSEISGDDKYRQSVYDVYRYYLENYWLEDNQMLQWGGHMAVNMADYSVEDRLNVHELKDHYPLFDVMYEIDPEKAERYMKGIWKAHVKYPDTLEFSRHFSLTTSQEVEDVDGIFTSIQNTFDKDTQPYFEGHAGVIPFITAANDYIYAAEELYGLTGNEDALQCAIDMQNMYLKGRHDGSIDGKEGTGLIPFIFTSLGKEREPIYDVWAPDYTSSGFGNRIAFNLYDMDNYYNSDFGAEYDKTIDITIYCYNPMVMFRMANKCDDETKRYLIDEAVETLAAFVKYKYNPTRNEGLPMLIDGTDLTGYVRLRSGYTGSIGATFEPWTLEADYILAFIRGYINAYQYDDEKMNKNADIIWDGIRNIFDYYGVGDVGTAPGENVEMNYDTDCEEPFVLISLCEAYNKFKVNEYLEIAKKVAQNIARERFSDGYFYAVDDMLHANFNTEEPYALLYYLATVRGIAENLPEHFGSRGYFQFDWYDESTDTARKLYSNKLWSLRTSSEVLANAIELNASELTMTAGEKFALIASIEPEDTEDQSVEYESADKDVCVVDEDGVITAVGKGETTVTATAVSGGCETKVIVKVQ